MAITGMGLISPIGQSLAEAAASLRTAVSGIRLLHAQPISKPFAAGTVLGSFEEEFPKLERPFLDRCQHMAILAARQAIGEAGYDDFSGFEGRAGLYYGNVNGGTATGQAWFEKLLVEHQDVARPFTAMAIMGNAGGAQIAIRHKILGPVISNASACGSSGVAIGEAARAIADGYIDVAVAGGAEAPLTAVVMGSFAGTRAMAGPDPEDVGRTCKPFSRQRSGLVLGEGSAFVMLEEGDRARRRGAKIYGYLTGYGVSCDAHHIGMPASGGQIAALQAAVADAGLAPGDIGYVNAHATATHGGDVIEATSIRSVFGEGDDAPYVSSTKSVHGHLLGATSALEFVLTTLAMQERLLPASAHLGEADEKCSLRHVGETPIESSAFRHALSFSCGFGGTNVALIVSSTPKP
ncbi:MAG: beta-ketoacyl-[acyl-carrier-protein] synthase family protein [Pseudoxanthomonas sp.]